MAKKAGITYEEIVRQVQAGDFKPIYYLMGEEAYYIDRVSDYIVQKALTENALPLAHQQVDLHTDK